MAILTKDDDQRVADLFNQYSGISCSMDSDKSFEEQVVFEDIRKDVETLGFTFKIHGGPALEGFAGMPQYQTGDFVIGAKQDPITSEVQITEYFELYQ